MTATATSASTHPLYRDAGISGGRSTTKRLVNVSPLVIDFGRVPVGLTATSRLTIQNTSDRRVSFSVLEETRVALPATLLWSPMRGTVDVHGVVQVRLTFRPDCMGPLARTLVVSTWVRSPNESSVSGTSVVRGGLGSQPSLHASSNAAAAAAAAAGAVESVRLRVQGMALARRALYLPQLEPKPSTQVASSAIKGLESVEERREETRMLSWAFGDLYMDPELSGMNAVRRLDVVSLSDEPLMIRIRSNLTKQIVFFSDEEAQKPLPVAVQLAPGATLPVYVGIAPRMPLNELWTGAVRALVAGIRLMAWTRDRDEWNEQHDESVLQAVVDAVTVKLQARVGFTFPLRLRALEVTAAPMPERCPLPRELVQPTSLIPLWSTAVMNASMNESSTSSLLVPSWLQPSRERDRSPSWLLNTAWYCLGDRGRLVIRNPNAGLGLRLQLRYGPLERMSEATTGAADTQSFVCSTKDGVLDEPVLSLTHHQVVIEPLADLSMEYEWRSIESGLYHQWIYLENRAYSRRTFDLQLVFIHNIRSSRSSLPMLHMMHSEPCLISASTAMVTRPGIWTLDASRSRQLASKQPPMSLSWRLYVDGFPVQWPCSVQEQNDGRNAERWVQRMLAEPQPEGLFWESGPNELSYRLIPSLLHEEEWNALVQGALVRRRALLVAQLGHQWLGSLPVSLRFGCARLALKTDTISVGTLGYSQGNATVTVTGVIRNVSAVATKWRVVPSSLPAGVDIFSSNQVGDERQTVGHSEDASGALVGPADHDLGSGQTSSQVVACRETLSTEVNRSEAVTFGAATEPDRPPLMLRTSKEMVEPPNDVGRGSETILASSKSSTLSETPSALTDRHQDANVSEDVVDKDLVSLGSRTANMILGDGVHLDAGEEALLGLVLRPAAMDLAAGPFQLPVVIENVFQPENRLVLLIQGVYSIRLLNETNPIYLNEQGRGVLSIGIPEAAQGDVEVKWHVQLVPGGPYTDVTLQDRASGATLRSLTLASGEKFELQVSASTAVNDEAATAQCQALCGLCSSVDSSDNASCRQRPVAWIELYLQRKQDTEACCRPERIPVYGAEYSLNRACSNAAEHAVGGFSDPSIVDGARESAKRESVGPVSSSSRLGSNLDAGPLVGYPVAAEPTTLLPVPIKTDVQGLTPPNGAGIDEAMAQNKAERLAATQREETGQALSEPISVEAAAVSSSGWVDTLEEDVGPRSFRLHGCAHVGAHLYEMDAGMVPLRSQQIQRTLVIVQRVADGTLPLSGQTGVGSVAETRTDPVESALEYKLHRIPTHWRRHDTEQVEWLSLDRMGGIIEPSRASQTITLTMQPHRLGLFREYLLLTDRKAPANLALIRVGMEVVAERTDASTIFQTSPMAIDYGSVMLHHVYRNKSIRIRNVSDQPLEFLLRHDLPSQARSELHFSTSNLALRKVTSVWVEKGASRRIFLYFRPEPETEESEQTTSIISRAFHLYVSCRLVRDYEESVEIRCACHPPQLRISTNDISFAVPSLSWRPSPTANLTIETLAPAVPDLYEVRSSALFFTVTERERGILCIQPRLDAIAELAPDEKYIEEHCSVYNRRRPREFFWIRLRIKVGGDSAPEFSAALPRKRVFVLEETVSRFLCLYAAFWAPYRRPRTPGAGTDSMQLAVAAGERGAEDLVDRLRARQRWQDHDEREPLHLWVERIRQATGVDTQPGTADGNVPTAYAALVFEAHYCTDELVFYALRDQSDAVLQLALTCYSYVFKYDVFQVYMRGDEAIIRALAPVVKFWYGQVRHLLSFFPDSDRSDRPGLRTLGPLQALGQLAATEWSRESVERA
ncbi:hypothetical protein F1559_004482 [Cyanidiococcus yangmingshanensis]|uniref:HYDIN/VesB/CFA65-like Ig-like domain-containing protein n=1 Tax=Cyanidiococcus yangmingshanensis TaxID=2690220 RepID=A0A7J7IMM0_9RHOD|nr:hypothetical protein F1559_004482 [Cyanidiococcus yangmingshanensis]